MTKDLEVRLYNGYRCPMKSVTFEDIANYTNLSKATISRYFNNPSILTEKTQNKIKRALKELNYTENKLAKGLANGRSEFIGILIPNLYMNYYAEMLSLILSSFEKYQFKFLVFQGKSKKEFERNYLNELMSYQIEGLIVFSHTLSSRELEDFNIPIVSIERESTNVPGISVDNYKGGEMAAKHLLEIGCEHFIHITDNPHPNRPANQRRYGFKDFLQDHEKTPVLIEKAFGSTLDKAKKILSEIFEEIEENYPKEEVKGIFFTNDTYANIFENFLIQKYGTFPDTYKLIGFDDTSSSREAAYPITTIKQPKEKIISLALDSLSRQIELKRNNEAIEIRAEHFQIEPILIKRATTKPVGK